MSEYITHDQRRALLDAGVVHGNFTLASGMMSKEKFDFDRIDDSSELFQIAIKGLTACIKDTVDEDLYDSIAIVTVADGANRLGDALAENLSMYHVPSRKDEDGNLYIPERTEGITGILVDDVYTTDTNFEKVKDQFTGRLIGAYALLDRSGRILPVLSGGVRVHSVIRHVL